MQHSQGWATPGTPAPVTPSPAPGPSSLQGCGDTGPGPVCQAARGSDS